MKNTVKLFVLVMLMSSVTFGATILHYDFEDGTAGEPMNDFPVTQQNGTLGTVDLSGNDYHMYAWDDYYGPMFSSEGDTPSGKGLSSFYDGHRDGYAWADGLVAWSPSTWTIELSFKFDSISGWQTLIGKDGQTTIPGDIAAAMYIQSNGENDAIRLNFATVSNERIVLDSSLVPELGKWYHFAIVTDGDRIDMYVNKFDGLGFQNAGSRTMTPGVDHSLQPTGTWTFGRCWYDGNFVDHISGNLDNIRFSDVALTPDQFIPNQFGFLEAWNPDPADGSLVTDFQGGFLGKYVKWIAGRTAVSHDVYFGTNYDDVEAGTGGTFVGNQTDTYFLVGYGITANDPLPGGLVPGTTYYWRVDEVDDTNPDSPWKGDVWSFMVPSKKAYQPSPADGVKYISSDVTLSWTGGFGVMLHYVYFGESFEEVDAMTQGTMVPTPSYKPVGLENGKTYYWRVDQFDNVTTHKGDVWSFTTIPDISVTDPNLLGWWKFDEGKGTTAIDWSGQGNHGQIRGGTEWIDGFDGGALMLKGQNGYVNLPIGSVIASMDSATFATWVNFTNAGGSWQRIFDFGSGTGTYIFLCPRMGTGDPMRLATQSGGQGYTEANAPAMLPTGWHHVAAVITSGSMQLYLDGAVVASAGADTVPMDLGNTSNNWLGRSQYVADGYFNGSLDDFRIYDYVLSADEIVEIMRGDPLVAWNAMPANGTTPDIRAALPLSWSAGEKASQHDVYFGTDADAVENADTSTPDIYRRRQAETSYNPPEGVEWGGGPYYWRIDEFNTDGTISTGRVWSFTVADFILVDDFEAYDANDNQVWYSWHDGLGYGAPGTDPYYAGNGTGAAVGDESTRSYMEENIVHSGGQSLPFYYNNNKQGYAMYSETELTLTSPRDWTQLGVTELSLWFRGYPASVGSFVEGPVGTFTMTASGGDIWNQSDEFHYAFKTLAGTGSIIARVASMTDTNPSAKAAVMIRETLAADSKYSLVALTPGNGVIAEYRAETGGNSQQVASETGIVAPYWVKLERDMAGNLTASSSANGSTWQVIGQPVPLQIASNAYVGLAVTAHNATATCEAQFSNVTISGNVGQLWANQDIGIASNDAEPLYVAVSNAAGVPAVVINDDPAAAQIDTWTEWVIPLQTLADQGISLGDVDRIAIGLGTKGSTTPGGAGKMFIDDIRLYRTRTAAE